MDTQVKEIIARVLNVDPGVITDTLCSGTSPNGIPWVTWRCSAPSSRNSRSSFLSKTCLT